MKRNMMIVLAAVFAAIFLFSGMMLWQDYRDQDPMKTGLQYSDFIMEDEDILYLTRTGLNEPSSFHNSNYCVFQRLKNFRAISE